MPFPPRKPSVKGKQWPTTAAAPPAASIQGWEPQVRQIHTEAAALAKSRTRVSAPRALPWVRRTLVAPMFPEPWSRMSTPALARVRR